MHFAENPAVSKNLPPGVLQVFIVHKPYSVNLLFKQAQYCSDCGSVNSYACAGGVQNITIFLF